MKIDVSRLREGVEAGFRETWNPKTQELDLPGLHYIGTLDISAVVKKDLSIVLAQVAVRAEATLTCARCFKDFKSALHKVFDFTYPVEPSRRFLLLDEDIREELILNVPHQILCRPACKGLCARCGADLNNEKCKCEDTASSV